MNYIKLDDSMSRKPRILGHMKVKKNSFHSTLLRQDSRYWLGSVYIAYPDNDDPTLSDLRKACSLHGFAFKDKSNLYYFNDYVYGAGSVSPHKDSGFGFTVGILVATRQLSKSFEYNEMDNNECFLFTKGKILSLTAGDVFIFDSNVEHAWMANCKWLIATQSVKLKRNR